MAGALPHLPAVFCNDLCNCGCSCVSSLYTLVLYAQLLHCIRTQRTQPPTAWTALPRWSAQACICMIAFFTVFWWNGVPLSVVYNHGASHWSPRAPDLEVCSGGACRMLSGEQQAHIYWAAQVRGMCAWSRTQKLHSASDLACHVYQLCHMRLLALRCTPLASAGAAAIIHHNAAAAAAATAAATATFTAERLVCHTHQLSGV